MSKSRFRPEEVIGYLTIDGKKVIYLKMGVKRQHRYQDHIPYHRMDHVNMALISYEKYMEYLKQVEGRENFEQN